MIRRTDNNGIDKAAKKVLSSIMPQARAWTAIWAGLPSGHAIAP
jgi:hypothetical protein